MDLYQVFFCFWFFSFSFFFFWCFCFLQNDKWFLGSQSLQYREWPFTLISVVAARFWSFLYYYFCIIVCVCVFDLAFVQSKRQESYFSRGLAVTYFCWVSVIFWNFLGLFKVWKFFDKFGRVKGRSEAVNDLKRCWTTSTVDSTNDTQTKLAKITLKSSKKTIFIMLWLEGVLLWTLCTAILTHK